MFLVAGLDISHGESNRQLISRRHFIKEPSCSFEGDMTTDSNMHINKFHG